MKLRNDHCYDMDNNYTFSARRTTTFPRKLAAKLDEIITD